MRNWRKFLTESQTTQDISEGPLGSVWDWAKDIDREDSFGKSRTKPTPEEKPEEEPEDNKPLAVIKKSVGPDDETEPLVRSTDSTELSTLSRDEIVLASSAIEKIATGTELQPAENQAVQKTANTLLDVFFDFKDGNKLQRIDQFLQILGIQRSYRLANMISRTLGLGDTENFKRLLREPEQMGENTNTEQPRFVKLAHSSLKRIFKFIKDPFLKLFIGDIIKKYWEIINKKNPHQLKSPELIKKSNQLGQVQTDWINKNITNESKK